MNAHFRLKCDNSFWMNVYFVLKCDESFRVNPHFPLMCESFWVNAHFLLKSDESFWQSLQSNAEDYELLAVKEFDDASSVHKKFSSVSNRSM